MEEIVRCVVLAQSDHFTDADLCEQFGINRKPGYKRLECYAATSLKGVDNVPNLAHVGTL